MILKAFYLLLIGAYLCLVRSLDVSFIPNDENAPLPLSQNYRDSLRKLCMILNGDPKRIPPELYAKRNVLEKICQKLAKDDNNISSAGKFDNVIGNFRLSFKSFLISLIAIGGGYLTWKNRNWFRSRLWSTAVPQNNRYDEVPNVIEQDGRLDILDPQNQIREARLKRFAAINNCDNENKSL